MSASGRGTSPRPPTPWPGSTSIRAPAATSPWPSSSIGTGACRRRRRCSPAEADYHHYFKAPADQRSWTIAPGLELKAANRQLVAPPSVHPETDRVYVWDPNHPLIEDELAELPAWLRGDRRDVHDHRGRDRDLGGDPLMSIPADVYVPMLLGREVGRDRKVECPFHSDWSPSLHVYEGHRGWCCFQCGRGGTIIDLGAALYELEPRGRSFHDLRRRLASELLERDA